MSILKASQLATIAAIASLFGGAKLHIPERSRDNRSAEDVADRMSAATLAE